MGVHIRNNLRIYRKEIGYRQHHVAKLLGIKNTSEISRWEQGKLLPGTMNLLKLSILYQVSVKDLYVEFIDKITRELLLQEGEI